MDNPRITVRRSSLLFGSMLSGSTISWESAILTTGASLLPFFPEKNSEVQDIALLGKVTKQIRQRTQPGFCLPPGNYLHEGFQNQDL